MLVSRVTTTDTTLIQSVILSESSLPFLSLDPEEEPSPGESASLGLPELSVLLSSALDLSDEL